MKGVSHSEISAKLRYCARHFSCDGCPGECYVSSKEPRTAFVSNEAADAIEELRSAAPHWISVEEALPKNAGQMCLVCAKNSFGQQSVFNAFTGYGDFNWYTYDTTKMRSRLDNNNAIALGWEITHWMPLPEPPKEVE